MHTLEIDHVTKRYGSTAVVRDLTFTVEPGRVTGFLGPNGAGKSTLMKVLLDLAAADAGTATIGGKRYASFGDPVRTVGVMLEANAFHPARTGRNHLRVLADAGGIPTGRIDELLGLVDLADAADRRVGAYSLGMRQRLGIAAALLGEPPVLILDEPGNGLDPQGIRWLRDLLRRRAADGGTVFVSSHLLAEMEHLADELVVINKGQLVTRGPIAELQHAATTVRCSDPPELALALIAAGAAIESRAGGLLVRGMPMEQIGDLALSAGIAIHELTQSAGSLEELFLGWTDQAQQPHATVSEEVSS